MIFYLISTEFYIVGKIATHCSNTRTTDTQWRHKSKISENLGRCGRQNMLPPYLKIWEWEWIFGRAVKAISSLGVRSPWSIIIKQFNKGDPRLLNKFILISCLQLWTLAIKYGFVSSLLYICYLLTLDSRCWKIIPTPTPAPAPVLLSADVLQADSVEGAVRRHENNVQVTSPEFSFAYSLKKNEH